ncbi:hypothetical protein KESI111651_10255 [Kerstersia similis]
MGKAAGQRTGLADANGTRCTTGAMASRKRHGNECPGRKNVQRLPTQDCNFVEEE